MDFRVVALALVISGPALAQETRLMAYRDTYLTWEPSADPSVNGYFLFRQDGDATGPVELVGMSRDPAELLTLPRCVPARFVIDEMRFPERGLRYAPAGPDVTILRREPLPWMKWCGEPDLTGDGVVNFADVTLQRAAFGRRLEGDEWVR